MILMKRGEGQDLPEESDDGGDPVRQVAFQPEIGERALGAAELAISS